jgi:predicted RNA-binding Zn-ribbon protein involved in translation (DUF1610 family)
MDTPKIVLQRLYKEKRNWRLVAESLCLNKGLVYAVAKGQRKPTPQVYRALHIPIECKKMVTVCPKCGNVPLTTRCPTCRKPAKRTTWDEREANKIQRYTRQYNG